MKVIKVAAIVIGVAALALTGVGLVAGASLAASIGFVGAGIGTLTGLGATVGGLLAATALAVDLNMLSTALAPKPSAGGQQTRWKADPYAGIPYVMGRTLVGGNVVYRRGHGPNNQYETFTTVLGLGPISSIDATFANRTTVAFGAGGAATGSYMNAIWQRSQLGACPEAAALVPPIDVPPGWTGAHKLSGLAAVMNTFAYDAKGSTTLTSEPRMGWIIQGALVYDPRLDSTYPGGSGPCRALVESTYVWSENPHLHGLTWTLGRWQNGKRVAGIGAPLARIDVGAFVEGANLDDARGWKVGGQVYTRPDTPWNSLKSILQAGGARPVMVGGTYSCINRAPRVSLATIGPGDIVGKASFSGTQPRRSRLNGIIPQYRSEEHDWEMVSASPVVVPAYVALDGDERTKEVPYALVQQVDQASQLAAYDICDAREAGPGTIPLKPVWFNYRVGDCLTFAPEAGWSTKVQVVGRTPDAAAGTVTYTIRSETDGKHDFALGKTGTPPPTASFSYDESIAAPTGDWTLSGAALAANGSSIPVLVLTGAVTNPSADAVIVEYRVHSGGLATDEDWIGASVEAPTIVRKEITSVTPGTSYDVSVRYRVRSVLGGRAVMGPAVSGAFGLSRGAFRVTSLDPAYPVSSDDESITIVAASAVIDDGRTLALPPASITGLSGASNYALFWNLASSAYEVEAYPATTRMASSDFAFIVWQSTLNADGTEPTGDTPPPGYGGGGYTPRSATL